MRFALTLCVTLAACGGGDDGPDPEQACRDFADSLADMCVRCFPADPDAYSTCYDFVIQDLANGDCANVKSVRDATELYDECLPWMRTVACSVVTTPGFKVDSSCQGQLEL